MDLDLNKITSYHETNGKQDYDESLTDYLLLLGLFESTTITTKCFLVRIAEVPSTTVRPL